MSDELVRLLAPGTDECLRGKDMNNGNDRKEGDIPTDDSTSDIDAVSEQERDLADDSVI